MVIREARPLPVTAHAHDPGGGMRVVDEGGAGTSGRGDSAGGLGGADRAACAGVTEFEAVDAAPVPTLFVAVTVKL